MSRHDIADIRRRYFTATASRQASAPPDAYIAAAKIGIAGSCSIAPAPAMAKPRTDISVNIQESRGMIRGRHFQNAYVTRNVDKWVEEFRTRTGVTDAIVFEAPVELTTVKGTGLAVNRLAFIWVDNLQYELIQPISGMVDIYADELPDNDDLKFHHICMRVSDWDEFEAEVKRQPYEVVLRGGNPGLQFVYLDAREFLGHYLEYVWMTDERWTQVGGR